MRNRIILFLASCVFLASCASTPEKIVALSLRSETIDATADGISVVHMTVAPTVEDMTEILSAFGEPIGSIEVQESLQHEGLQLLKIEAVDLPAIVASLGTVKHEAYAWHGQVLDWRDFHQRAVDKGGMLISADGVLYFIQRGLLSYLSRAWFMENEDGYFIYFQGLPTWHVPRTNTSIISKNTGSVENQVFSNLQLETLLRDGEAVLLASYLRVPDEVDGPQDGGGAPVRLGEALMGGPVQQDVIKLLIMEANIMPRM